ncbi:MAG: 2,5-diamino-6-(ribosylamino)-4(3H)-pyrimidinone 5'-phosphate reductase [Desulfurococcales archaeon]|nr:2,5-diamino-6-(ribosylamino)-4(3H)-pyrimidinone 5'-phosphate reductase [Desulfurococcales archaeon]
MPRPYTVVFSTMTVDGRIASKTGYSRLSCWEDFELQHKIRAASDIVIVGSGTALIDDPKLTVRRVPGRSPMRGVVDSKLRVPPTAQIFQRPGAVLITTSGHGLDELKPYRRLGVVVIQAGVERVDLAGAWSILYDMGVRRVMVEGGGRLNFALLREGLVDEVWVTVAPYVFGAGVSVFEGPGFDGENEVARLRVKEIASLCGGGWVNIRFEVLSPRRPL